MQTQVSHYNENNLVFLSWGNLHPQNSCKVQYLAPRVGKLMKFKLIRCQREHFKSAQQAEPLKFFKNIYFRLILSENNWIDSHFIWVAHKYTEYFLKKICVFENTDSQSRFNLLSILFIVANVRLYSFVPTLKRQQAIENSTASRIHREWTMFSVNKLHRLVDGVRYMKIVLANIKRYDFILVEYQWKIES